MASVDGSRTILAGTANYAATDWAGVSGGGTLDLQAEAEFRRGFDLQLGAEALVGLDASVAKFLALDLKGQASAAARVRAQVQVPLDLFSEAGLAIRLQATAEAAAGVELAIGLDVGDFLALAEADPRIGGVGLRLLITLLEEATISGAVHAKAAAAAMAYANVACTGQLLGGPGGPAGFTVAAEAGLGLKAGAGFRVSATLGIDEPGRLVRRCADVIVDDAVDRIGERITTAADRALLDELRTPSKIAIRTCFELGAELGRNPGFSAAHAPVVAQRCVEVAMEEAQRYLLDRLADLGFARFRAALEAIGVVRAAWDAAEPQRFALADRIVAGPADPFEPTTASVEFWTAVVTEGIELAATLDGSRDAHRPWVEPLAITWAATQLAFVAVRRISDSGARATLLGSDAATAFPPFDGPALAPAPALVAEHISTVVRPGVPATEPTLPDLVGYLLRTPVVDGLLDHAPAVRAVLDLVGGDPLDAAVTVMGHVGGFVATGAGGDVDPMASLDRVLAGLQAYVDGRLRTAAEPVLRAALAGADPELSHVVDEVLLPAIGFTTGTVFTQVRAWTGGSALDQSTLREACSAVVMNLVGRSLVVTTDVLLDRALDGIADALRDASAALNRRGGVVDQLAQLVPVLDRTTIRDAVVEIFDVAVDVFGPLPPPRRARIRELLYEVIETRPTAPGADLSQQLRDDAFVPNAEAATALALELGGMIRDNFVALVGALVERVADAVLAAIEDFVAALEAQVVAWLGALQGVLDDAVAALLALDAAIDDLRRQVDAAADDVLDAAEEFLGVLAAPGRRAGMRGRGSDVVRDACLAVLAAVPGYTALPAEGRALVRDSLDTAIDALVDDPLVDDLGAAIESVAGGLADFLADARAVDPADDVAGALVELLVDRVEDAIRDEFGDRIRFPFAFRVRASFQGPDIAGFRPTVDIDQRFDLGEIRIDVDELVRVLRGWACGLQAVTGAAHTLGTALRELADLERLLDADELAAEDARARRDRADRHKRDTLDARPDVRILHPGAAAAYPGAVPVEIAIDGVAAGFLGRDEDAHARVHVFLDDRALDLARFDVQEDAGPGLRPVGRSPILGPGLRRPGAPAGAGLDGAASGSAPGQATSDSWRRVAPVTSALARVVAPEHVANPAVDRRIAARASRLPGDGPPPAAATRGRRSSFGGPSTPSGGRAGATVGRRPRVSATDRLVTQSLPGLLLRTSLGADELTEGFHTLTVVVTTGGAAPRVTETVVFHSSAAAALTRPPGGFRPPLGPLPARPVVDPTALDPALAVVAAGGGARRSVRATATAAAPARRRRARARVVPPDVALARADHDRDVLRGYAAAARRRSPTGSEGDDR